MKPIKTHQTDKCTYYINPKYISSTDEKIDPRGDKYVKINMLDKSWETLYNTSVNDLLDIINSE